MPSAPKCDGFFLRTRSIFPPNFVEICSVVFSRNAADAQTADRLSIIIDINQINRLNDRWMSRQRGSSSNNSAGATDASLRLV